MWGGAVGFSALPETPRPIFPVGILCCLLLLASLSGPCSPLNSGPRVLKGLFLEFPVAS